MLYRIKFISDEVEGFLRELNIDSEATFLDLNCAILDACGYPDDQMTSFYLCDHEWERKQQITREDMGVGDADQDIYVMGETPLSELIEDEGQRMEFVFDPFGNRSFYLEVKETIPGKNLKKAELLRSKGDAPQQIELSEDDSAVPVTVGKNGTNAASDDFGDDAFGTGSSFNDDEIDLEGFEISDGQPY